MSDQTSGKQTKGGGGAQPVKDLGKPATLEILETAVVYMRAAGWLVIVGNTPAGDLGLNVIGAQTVEEAAGARFRERATAQADITNTKG